MHPIAEEIVANRAGQGFGDVPRAVFGDQQSLRTVLGQVSNKFSERTTRKRLLKAEQTLLHDRRQSTLTAAVGRYRAEFFIHCIPMLCPRHINRAG